MAGLTPRSIEHQDTSPFGNPLTTLVNGLLGSLPEDKVTTLAITA